jgi:hypothetical protein
MMVCVFDYLCMQQHVASKKHKEKQVEWEGLLAASCADSGGIKSDEDDGGQGEATDEVPVLDDSDEEFEAQLRRMHLGGDQALASGDAGAEGAEALDQDSDDFDVVADADSDVDDEKEAAMSAGKKKKKKKAKRNVMGASSLLEEEIAEIAVQFVSCNGSDEEEGDVEPAPGKKLTKKQIRR